MMKEESGEVLPQSDPSTRTPMSSEGLDEQHGRRIGCARDSIGQTSRQLLLRLAATFVREGKANLSLQFLMEDMKDVGQ